MKKIIIVLLFGIFLLSLNSCADGDDDWFNIDDTLRIYAFLFNEDAGEDYFILNEWGMYEYNRSNNVYKKDGLAYVPERLKLNEVRLMYPIAPWGAANDMINLNIFVEFNGEVEVISENEDVQLGFNNNHPNLPKQVGLGGSGPSGFKIRFPSNEHDGVFFSASPLGSHTGSVQMGGGVNLLPHKVGREYYLTVNRYSSATAGIPNATARLRLVQLEDKYQISLYEKFPNVPVGSGVFSIELISYEAKYKESNGVD
jgi:hypothetical protein